MFTIKPDSSHGSLLTSNLLKQNIGVILYCSHSDENQLITLKAYSHTAIKYLNLPKIFFEEFDCLTAKTNKQTKNNLSATRQCCLFYLNDVFQKVEKEKIFNCYLNFLKSV